MPRFKNYFELALLFTMDTLNSLTAELYFWGHFDVFQDAAEQFAERGIVDYQKILDEKVEHHLRATLRQLPLHQSLGEAIKEWFSTAEFFSRKCPDWESWGFPSEKELEIEKTLKEKEYLLPVMHLCKLAIDAFDVASDGRLCRFDEEDMILFKRFGCIPPNLLGATRYAMKPGLIWDGKNVVATSQAAAQEFQVLIQRGLADAHVHLSGAACFSDLLNTAIRGIAPPRPSFGGEFDFLENGNTHGSHDFPFHYLAVRPLLLACKAMLALLLFHAGKPQERFEKLLDDSMLSRQFWNLAYLAAKEIAEKKRGGNSAMRFYMVVDNVLKRVGNYKRFFDRSITFEKNWFTIVRHVLESQKDRVLCYHFSQLTRCISCLYRPMFHREGFYEFDHLFRYLDLLTDASGNPDGRPPRRVPKDVPLERVGYDSMQNQCKNLRRLQLRMTVRAERKRPSRRPQRKTARKPLVTKKRMEVELLNHLVTYRKYIEEQKKLKCWFCEKKIKEGEWKDKCPHCGKKQAKNEPMTITFPIHFIRREMGDGKKHREEFQFKFIWHRLELLASLFQDKPALRYFFGRIDVANNEDLKPNWIFALVFQEIEDRLKKIPVLSGDIDIPRMRYNCHAGEHFTSSIQGLRRIWEPVRYFPRLDGIGHAFALGIPGRMPTEMPADELIDDLRGYL